MGTGTILAFGTYIPGTSPIHMLNAQVKIILTCVFSICIFLVDGWMGMGLFCLLTVLLYMLAQVHIGKAFVGLRPIVFILVFTVIVHMFTLDVNQAIAPAATTMGSIDVDLRWPVLGTFGITSNGLAQGIYFALRIALLVAICSLLTFTTSMVALTDGMLRLFKPLRRLHVPVDDLAMIVSIALRFIPTTAEEAVLIAKAQKARGADFEGGNIFKRLSAWVPVLVPLFVRLFHRADELAVAMDARCYTGEGRTHAHEEFMRPRDVLILIIFAAVFITAGIVM